jgi:hypothetical protein
MPHDYFVRDRSLRKISRHPFLRYGFRILHNLLGILLLPAGIAMLVLPGQGLLTILISLTLINFPGKRKLEIAILGKRSVYRAVNSLRQYYGRREIELPPRHARERSSEASGSQAPRSDMIRRAHEKEE